MLESQSFVNWNKVVVFFSLASDIVKDYSSNTTFDFTISTVCPCDFNKSEFIFSTHLHDFGIKPNHAWLIFIKDSDCAHGIVTNKPFSSFRFTYFNVEIFIRLPNIIVNYFDLDLGFLLTSSHFNHFLERFVVVGGFGCTVPCAHEEDHLFVYFLDDGDFDVAGRLCHGDVGVLETDFRVRVI